MRHYHCLITCVCLIASLLSAPVFADLQSQLDKVAEAEKEVKVEQAKQNAEKQKVARAQRLKQAQMQKQNEEYEKELKQLKLLDLQLEMEAKRARLGRTNEYIDADLAIRRAEADRISASAESERQISSGLKTHLEKTGDAALTKATQ